MTGHIVLMGDSIFDNGLYVPGGPSVIDHTRRLLPDGWKSTLIAVDGAVVSSVHRQIERIPDDATHLVLSVGGNNALWTAGNIFSLQASDVRQSLRHLADAFDEFRAEYEQLVDEICQLQLPLAICTVYDAIPGLDSSEVAGLTVFNDTITRTAFARRLTLIDLRVICDEASDYSAVSPIEPSAGGGAKIARAIMGALTGKAVFSHVITTV